MDAEKNHYGANIWKAWLSGSGKYTATQQDIIQVQQDTLNEIRDLVGQFMDDQGIDAPGNCPQTKPIVGLASKDFQPNGGTYENIAFTRRSNLNMFFAFGGADFEIVGTAILVSQTGDWDCECEYSVSVDVTLQDTFTFKPTGPLNLRLANRH